MIPYYERSVKEYNYDIVLTAFTSILRLSLGEYLDFLHMKNKNKMTTGSRKPQMTHAPRICDKAAG